MTKQEWAACAKGLASAYPLTFKLDDVAAVAFWGLALADLPGERVMAAVVALAQSKTAFPSIAELRQLAAGAADAAVAAWAEAMAMASRHGDPAHQPYRPLPGEIEVVDGRVRRLKDRPAVDETVVYADPLTARAVEAVGGLRAIALCPSDRVETMRAQFLKIYDAFSAEAKRQTAFGLLGVPAAPSAAPSGQLPTPIAKLMRLAAPKQGETP